MAQPNPPLRFQSQVGAFYDNLARYEYTSGALEVAEASATTAIEWHQRMLERTGHVDHGKRLGKSLPLLAAIQLARGGPDSAIETLTRGVDAGVIPRATFDEEAFAALREREDFRALVEAAVE